MQDLEFMQIKHLIFLIFFVLWPLIGFSQTSLTPDRHDKLIDSFQIGNPWTEKTKLELYHADSVNKIADGFLALYGIPPFVSITDLSSQILSSSPNKKAQELALHCKSRFPNNPLIQIRCLSSAVHDWVLKMDWGNESINYNNFDSACKKAYLLFEKSLNLLHLKNVYTSRDNFSVIKKWKRWNPPHFVSILIFKVNDSVFSYVLDVINEPNTLFPTSYHSIQHHDINSDGETDIQDLPFSF